MTKILNLDEVESTIDKTLVIKGVSYAMRPFSVDEFINQMKEIEEVSKSNLTGVDLYKKSLEMIRRAFPGLTDEIIGEMTTFQIDAIYAFMKARTEDEAEQIAAEAGAGNGTGEA